MFRLENTKMYLLLFVAFFMGGVFLLQAVVLAESVPTGTFSGTSMAAQQNNAFAQSAGLSDIKEDPRVLVAIVMRFVMGFVGIALVAYGVYGGYVIVTSNGDSEQISMGKSTIVRSIMGLVIIFSAYSITYYVGNMLEGITTDRAGNTPGGLPSSPDVLVPTPNDPLFERDRNFVQDYSTSTNAVFPNTPDNGSGAFFEIDN